MSTRATVRRALACVIGAVLAVAAGAGGAAQQRLLTDWLRELRSAGVHILYRVDLFDPQTRVSDTGHSLGDLQRVLPQLGLELQRRNNVWMLRRTAAQAPGQAAQHVELPVIDSVIVTGTRYRFPGRASDPGMVLIEAGEMRNTPALAGDSLRVVTRLPGVSGIGISARPHFRGGLQDEVLVSIDGVSLLDPTHLSDFHSLISAVDDRTVASMDVYTGAFPARYGNRLSAVMEMSTQQPPAEFDTELEASLYSLSARTRGTGRGPWAPDWLLSARAGDLARITRELNARSGEPEFQDLFGRIDLAPREDASLRLAGFYTRDDATLREEEEHAASRIERMYLWTQWQQALGEAFDARLTASWTQSDHDKRELSLPDPDPDPSQSVGGLDFGQDLQRFALLAEFGGTLGGTQLEFGADLAWAEADYAQVRNFRRGLLGAVLGTGRRVDDTFSARADGFYGGAYAAAEIPLGEMLYLQPGLRWDFQDYYFDDGDSQVSPRLGLRAAISDTLSAHLSMGRYHQPEGVHELQALDGERQFSAAQAADQVALGTEWNSGDSRLRAEVWHKHYRDPKTRYENLYNTFVLMPYTEPDRVPVVPSRARAEGADVELRHAFTPALTGTLRLGYLDARDRVEGSWIDRRWSQRVTGSGMLQWQHREWSLSAALSWHSGWHSSGMPAQIDAGTRIPIASVLNNRVLRDYLALDIAGSRSWRLGASELTLFGGLSNALDRNNIAGLDYDIEPGEGTIDFVPTIDTALPLVPMIGVRIAF